MCGTESRGTPIFFILVGFFLLQTIQLAHHGNPQISEYGRPLTCCQVVVPPSAKTLELGEWFNFNDSIVSRATPPKLLQGIGFWGKLDGWWNKVCWLWREHIYQSIAKQLRITHELWIIWMPFGFWGHQCWVLDGRSLVFRCFSSTLANEWVCTWLL